MSIRSSRRHMLEPCLRSVVEKLERIANTMDLDAPDSSPLGRIAAALEQIAGSVQRIAYGDGQEGEEPS